MVRLSFNSTQVGPRQLRLPASLVAEGAAIGSSRVNKQAGGSVLLSQLIKWNPCRASGRQQALGERLANGFQKSEDLRGMPVQTILERVILQNETQRLSWLLRRKDLDSVACGLGRCVLCLRSSSDLRHQRREPHKNTMILPANRASPTSLHPSSVSWDSAQIIG